ncbi:Plasmid stabilization protein [Bosea sp. 62]|uniref:type II toxin-antitoxin system RelE/ParE family toxin n=1 Tax=unclassified Bosea (in: a-proteobacteria) TaxID=2653178 RepID=UPI0012523613|nr:MULTISPECIES: type II toxin-antitoxin system RelE/ParE family toxin [unclassified Bosea (in: a-proteobacteria)]CAD5287990.1 Plasmid stabilization protein [Bosea sp. 7B]CAD5292585.1 Plasmid stabilization protein [Bosea sp. 21B]CAD5301129.1 Plasmid stabilization protein [Bosea sp. 46]VVT62265.1 putative plasmid stabilization system protein [Bosea sp. EC-HK365B]VXB64886.1 Plasmid stabilization protein [Bosea sp. 125]
MTKRVRYTPRAEADLFEIWVAVAKDSERAADALITRIVDKIELAAEVPYMGVARPTLGSRARILIEGRYVVIYQPGPPALSVVAVVHGRSDPETWLS